MAAKIMDQLFTIGRILCEARQYLRVQKGFVQTPLIPPSLWACISNAWIKGWLPVSKAVAGVTLWSQIFGEVTSPWMPFHVGHKGHSAAQITKFYLHAVVIGSVKILMCGHGSQQKFRQSLASFPGTKRRRRRRKGLVSAVCAALNHYGIPLLPHTIDILLYICDTNTDTTCYTVCSLL